ncbi:MAG: hypothetical protein IPK46_18255 [Saprospiraceae bacterium]|nr:hypothetical protein [Saprospiraceae bacterium]
MKTWQVAEGLKTLINGQNGMECQLLYSNAEDAITFLPHHLALRPFLSYPPAALKPSFASLQFTKKTKKYFSPSK